MVSIIPAEKSFVREIRQLKETSNIRVAAYCRVSTGDESQHSSYTNQKAFYSALIQDRPGWKFAGIYADEGISGTTTAHREEFKRMLQDAREGKIDYIVTKSISRFARNTVTTLNCARELRSQTPPVGIYFEKENIDTLDAAGELILTIMSALAQDESRSISENIRWGIQKKFQAGIPLINLDRMLGYEKGEDGKWLINDTQAAVIRYIFRRFVSGASANQIAREINGYGWRTVNGKPFRSGAVLQILRNEKYMGDLEMQKTVTTDFLTHQSKENRGEAPRYYVKDHHLPIVSRTTWNKARAILESRSEEKPAEKKRKTGRPGPAGSPFSILRCGCRTYAWSKAADCGPENSGAENSKMESSGKEAECGQAFFRVNYSGTIHGYRDERSLAASGPAVSSCKEKYVYAYPVWRCKARRQDRDAGISCCRAENLHECALEQSFMEMLYMLKRDYQEHGGKSRIACLFRRACRERKRAEGQRPEDQTLCAEHAGKGGLTEWKENYDFFLRCLQELPEVNGAGIRLTVNGLDTCCGLDSDSGPQRPEADRPAPDYLPFERGIYTAFLTKGTVYGDLIEYPTIFGVRLDCRGNSRTLESFLGFRRCREDGIIEILDELYKISGKSIQYRRKLKRKSGE